MRAASIVELAPDGAPWPDLCNVDLLLLDACDGRDFDIIACIRRGCPDVRILVLAAGRGDYALAKAGGAGAHGVIHADDTVEVLATALNTVLAGGLFYGPGVAPKRGELPVLKALTDRELLVFEFACAGATDDDAAQAIGCASATVETHRRNLMRKLGATDRSELVVIGIRLGIVSADNVVTGGKRRRSSSRRNRP